MPDYINTRIRNVNGNWVVQAQRQNDPSTWDCLHTFKCPYPEMSKIIWSMAKSEAIALAQDLSKQTNHHVVFYDENDRADSMFAKGRNIKFH